MRIVVASDGLDIAPHFSQCLNYNFYTTKSYEIVDSQNIPSQGSSPEECAKLLDKIGVDTLICNGITPTTKSAFEAHGIVVVTQATGNALQAAEAYTASKANQVEEDEDEEEDD